VTPSAEGSLLDDLERSTGESSLCGGGMGVGCFLIGSGDTLGDGLRLVVGDLRDG